MMENKIFYTPDQFIDHVRCPDCGSELKHYGTMEYEVTVYEFVCVRYAHRVQVVACKPLDSIVEDIKRQK